MIDIKLIRETPEIIEKDIKKRGMLDSLKTLKEIKAIDESWRKLKYEADKLRHERNKTSQAINESKKQGKPSEPLLKKAKEIAKKLNDIAEKEKEHKEKIDSLILGIPNVMHPDVPKGESDKDNPEIKKWGAPKKFDFELINHAELIESMGLADFDAARESSGQGFNYIKGEIALLDLALQRYGVDFLIRKGFTLVVPPMLLKKEILLGVLNGLKDFEDVIYKVEGEDLYLIGTAEHSLVSMMKNKTVETPLKVCAVTPCFRKEIGSHGVDTKGLFRMHQFNKVEQVIFTDEKTTWDYLEETQRTTEEFFESLEIPYRVVEICSGDLGAKFARQYDIEAWFPRQNAYKEVTSAGNCTDFQARALNIKYKDGNEYKHCHIINNTMVATSRAIVAILENYQNKDGSITIPKVLQPYMYGMKTIKPKN